MVPIQVKQYSQPTFGGGFAKAVKPKLPFNDKKDHVYDLVVIGGGSGGLSCAKEARKLGLSVAIFDYVSPSLSSGKTWGLGGTCLNVGCIPKKLFHIAAQKKENYESASYFGWPSAPQLPHEWNTLRNGIQSYIKSINFGYTSQLAELGIDYINAQAAFKDKNTVEFSFKNVMTGTSSKHEMRASNFVIATGGRPRHHPQIPNELCITSDDIFSMEKDPGTTFVLGGGYIAIECAGFLRGLGKEVYIANRSTFLSTMDKDMAGLIVQQLQKEGVITMTQTNVKSVKLMENGRKKVELSVEGKPTILEVDTVLVAIGRDSHPESLRADLAGVKFDPKSGKIFGVKDEVERTNIDHIYAVGDIVDKVLQLQPVAAKSGKFLAHRISHRKSQSLTEEQIMQKYSMDYSYIPTTVFCSVEYSYVGMSEEESIKALGEDNIEVYHKESIPLQWSLGHQSTSTAYFKVIVNKLDNDRVVGMHYYGPYAEEVIGGFAVALKLGLTKDQLNRSIGVHPSVGEDIFSLEVTKRSGAEYKKKSC